MWSSNYEYIYYKYKNVLKIKLKRIFARKYINFLDFKTTYIK